MVKFFLYIIIFAVLFFFWFKNFEYRSIFFPTKDFDQDPSAIGLIYEDVYFKTKDGIKLNAWFIPAEGGDFTILFAHGNGGNISHRMDKISMFHEKGFSLFLYDYRGYGKSEGRPSELGIYRDTYAAYNYLVQEKGIPSNKIIVYGESLGGAPAVDIVSKVKTQALILEGAFSCAKDMSKEIYPFLPTSLLMSKLDSLSKIRNIKVPSLFIHSESDEIVPIELARKLFNAAPEPKKFLTISGGHNYGVIDFQDKVKNSIVEFVDSL
ncbi:MAG: alpha/beta hydrolase [Promethearchaeota archaeon]